MWPFQRLFVTSEDRKVTTWRTWGFYLGGGFKHVAFSPPTWGDDPIWRTYFSNGLVISTLPFWVILYDPVLFASDPSQRRQRLGSAGNVFFWRGISLKEEVNHVAEFAWQNRSITFCWCECLAIFIAWSMLFGGFKVRMVWPFPRNGVTLWQTTKIT